MDKLHAFFNGLQKVWDELQATVNFLEGTLLLYVIIGVLGGLIFERLMYWRIFSKAGFKGAWSILMITPFAPLATLYFVLFDWPAKKGMSTAPLKPKKR